MDARVLDNSIQNVFTAIRFVLIIKKVYYAKVENESYSTKTRLIHVFDEE